MQAKSLQCTFDTGSAANWTSGEVRLIPDKNSMILRYDAIDWTAGTARGIGNQGASNEKVFMTGTDVTFIEQTNLGSLVITTIFSTYKPGTTEFIAVASRHMNLLGIPVPSQYHGTCRIWHNQ